MNIRRIKRFSLIILLFCIIGGFGQHFYTSPTDIKQGQSLIPYISEENPAQGVVSYFRQVFEYDWQNGIAYEPENDGMGFGQSRDRDGSSYTPFARQDITDQMAITPILSPDNSEAEILGLINQAQSTLYIEQMYFKEGLDGVRDAIISAESRGVVCKFILGDDDGSRTNANTLQDAGVEIRISKSNASIGNYFDTQHNKGIIVDSETVLISSINWSPTSITENREAGLIIESDEVASYYLQLFNYDWGCSVEYDRTIHLGAPSSSEQPLSAEISEDHFISPPKASDYTPVFSSETFSGEMTITGMASPDNCFNGMNQLLEQAESSIEISVYTLSSPYIMDTLFDRIANGVQIRLLLERSNVGWYERSYNRWTMMNLTELGAPSIANPSINLTAHGLWASSSLDTEDPGETHDPLFSFQHSKYAIIDNKTLLLSSGNWGRSSCPKPQDDGDVDGNRDWWIAIYGSGSSSLPNIPDDNPDENPEGDYRFRIPLPAGLPILLFILTTATLSIIYEKLVKKSE